MKVHKVTLMIVDHDGLGTAGVRDVIENVRYPNHCMAPRVVAVESADIEWDDGHPLNNKRWREAFAALFAAKVQP